MPPISETPNGWLGSVERSEALKLAAARGMAARATGLMSGELDAELRASFERTTHQVARYLNVPVGLFSLMDGDCQMLIATNGVGLPEILPAEGSMCVHVRDTGRDVIIDDLTRHELGDLATNMTSAGANAYMGTPVFAPDGQPIGSLCAIDFPSRAWEPNDLDLLRSLAEGLTDKIALIEARTRAEASEARMAATIEAIPNVVYVFEPEGRIGYVSPTIETKFGLTRESLLGFGYLRHLRRADARALLAGMRARTEEPSDFAQEFHLRDGEGTERELLAVGKPFRDGDGGVGYVVSTTEIGHLRDTERALAIERGRLEAVLEALPHVVVLSSPERGVEYASPQALSIMGYDPEALLGFGIYDLLIHPDDRELMRVKRREWLTTPEGFQHEFRGRHADGHEMRMLLRGFPLPAREGVTHSHVVTFTDLEAIRAAEAETAEERRKLAGILDVLPTGLMLSDEVGRITRANDEARRMFGDRLDVALTDHDGLRAVFLEADGTETPLGPENAPMVRALRGEAVRGERTIRIVYPDGTERFVTCDAATLHDPQGGIEGAVMVATDITRLRHAETQVESERKAAAERLQTMLDGIPIWVGLVDLDGRLLGVNRPPVEAAGKRVEDVLGKVVWEEWTDGDPETTRVLRETIEAGARGERVTRDITYRWNGQEIETEYHVVPLRDAGGQVTMLSTSALDVTERNAARRRIEAEGELMRQIMEHSPIMKGLCDPEGRMLYANEAPLRAVGATLDDIVGKFVWETPWTANAGVSEIVHAAALRAMRGETVLSEIAFPGPDGLVEVEQRIAPIYGPDGTLRYLLPSAIDVTARNRSMREVDEERSRLRTILDVLPAGLLITDATGRVIDGNAEGWRLVTGSSEPSLEGMIWPRAWYQEFDGSETLIGVGEGPMPSALQGESVREPRTIRMIAPGGEVRFIKCDAEPLRATDGTVAGVAMTILDVTSLRRAQEAADQARIDSFARLERVIASLPINVVLADREGHLLYANEAPLRGAGLELGEVVGQLAWESAWMPDEATAQITREEYMKAASGETARREFSIRMGDSVIDIDHTVVPILDDDGEVEFLLPSSIDVTERNRALRRAEDERRRLSETVEGMPVGLFVFDREMNLLQANDEAIHATGMTPERIASGDLPEMFYIEPDGTETPCPHLEAPSWRALRGLDGRETRPMRFHHPGTDPSEDLFIRLEAAPLTTSDGAIEGAIVTAVDVKPLLEAEKALAREREVAAERVEEERRRLRQIVDNLPIGLFVFDRERRIIQANEEGLSSFGLSLAQMESRDYPEAVYIEADGSETPADVENAPLRRVLRGESGREPRTMRLRYPGADPAEDRFIRAEAAPLTDAEGDIEGAVFTVANVKPLREAELALNREREAATERLMATLEGISIFVWLLDLEGRIVWCNRAFLDAAGLKFADVESVQFWKGSWVSHDPDMAMRLGEATCDAAGGQASFFPVTARSVTGIMDIDVSLTPIFDETRTVKYLVASGMEVTQRNHAIRQIEDARMSAERAREIAERATRAKDEFLAVLSHELRTPLTPAMLGLELLVGDLDEALASVHDPELTASIRETMGSVRSNLEIQVRLIDDLLDVTRIARGKLELRKVPVDVHEAARHALSIVTPAAEEKGIMLTISPEAIRTTISADPARLRQILWNLLANAVKFTNPGGTIRVETEDAGRGMMRLKVVDDGLGIDAERLATIFDAFDQGDGTVSRGFGGLGLGLAIARSLARAHGGTLWATSAGKGRGATFVLDVPTVERGEITAEIEAREKMQRTHMGCRVLLVEDNLDTARFTAALLRRAEVEVVVAHSVESATREGAKGGWSAILTDIGLPDGDGIEVVRRLRAMGVDAPTIAMSGYGRDEDKARTADAGFRAHLVKPVVFERLLEVLNEILPPSHES